MSMTVAHIEVPEAKIAALCRRNGIRKLALFGSVLTDRFSDDSDIDVLVEFRPHERIGFFRLAENFQTRFASALNVDKKDPLAGTRPDSSWTGQGRVRTEETTQRASTSLLAHAGREGRKGPTCLGTR